MYSNLILGNISNLECVCGCAGSVLRTSNLFILNYVSSGWGLEKLSRIGGTDPCWDGDEGCFPTRVKVGAGDMTRRVLFYAIATGLLSSEWSTSCILRPA